MNATTERRLDPDTGTFRSTVTCMELTDPPRGGPPQAPAPGVRMTRWAAAPVDAYLALFHRIGDRWLWYGRLEEERETIEVRLRDQDYEVWRLWANETVAGMGELDRSRAGEVEVVYFGLLPECIGGGLGGYFLRALLHEAARPGVHRIWLHTCSEDHPDAATVYRRFGFRVCGERVEWVRDPRLRGLLPRTAGPHVPIPE